MGAGGGYGYQGDVPPLPEAEERRRSSALAAINVPRSLVQVYLWYLETRDTYRRRGPNLIGKIGMPIHRQSDTIGIGSKRRLSRYKVQNTPKQHVHGTIVRGKKEKQTFFCELGLESLHLAH